MLQTKLRVSKRISVCAVFSALAMVLSYAESISGINLLLPIPGTKLGLANIAVMVAAYILPLGYAFVVSLIRVAVSSLLFGTVTGFVFSFTGACFSFSAILVGRLILREKVSFTGTSVAASSMHMLGQLLTASLIMNTFSVIRLLPVYLLISVFTGIFVGIISQIIYNSINKYAKEYLK